MSRPNINEVNVCSMLSEIVRLQLEVIPDEPENTDLRNSVERVANYFSLLAAARESRSG